MPPEVADRVYRLGSGWVNFYLIVEDDAVTMVDAGYPGYHDKVAQALDALGLGPGAITSVLVTHHHVDHVGTAERVRSEGSGRVFAAEEDVPVIRGERRSRLPPGFYRQAWHPSMVRFLAHTVSVGGASYPPVSEVALVDEGRVDVAGRPRIVRTPGHTEGHYSVLLDERGVLLCGDAMVNLDYATGRWGPRLHRFNDDRARARASLDRLGSLDAGVVLFGHGEPWTHGLPKALELAREHV
jgi:glyoxylase-like metal-dependent hydrolase (beta-lactamase superfamily II)